MAERMIEVHGLRDLQRALRQMDVDAPKEMAAGLAEAADIVLRHARAKVPHVSGDARRSMTVRKKQTAAALAVGGSVAEYYPWLDFGGRVGRNGSVLREVIKGGRYIYPALAEKGDEVKAAVDVVIENMARRAGFEQAGRSDR